MVSVYIAKYAIGKELRLERQIIYNDQEGHLPIAVYRDCIKIVYNANTLEKIIKTEELEPLLNV